MFILLILLAKGYVASYQRKSVDLMITKSQVTAKSAGVVALYCKHP